jgi:alkanesulfonate monooxygenase SsuD/methylene tetrahydromethanopterin reductase-like flavin-dependent oxidoreductase (luciferase family)
MVPQMAGTPRQIEDELVGLWESHACDGFVITPAHLPEGFDAFVDGVVPLLQTHGLFPRFYAGRTLRDHLAEA